MNLLRIVILGYTRSDKYNLDFDSWFEEASDSLREYGFDPKRERHMAERAYNDGYTTDEYEEEWMSLSGIT